MITMEMLGKVRRLYFRDKVSLREKPKRTGLSRNTIREWLRKPDESAIPTYVRKDDRIMAQVLSAVPTAGLDAVLVAVELVIESGALSAEHVLNVLARLNASCDSALRGDHPEPEGGAAGRHRTLLNSLRGADAATATVLEVNHAS